MKNLIYPLLKRFDGGHLLDIRMRPSKCAATLFKSLRMFLISLAISGILYGCNGTPKNAQCLPIMYPTGEKSELESYEVARYQVTDPFEDVIDFFDENLDPIPVFQDWEAGDWQVENIDEGQVLFDCFAPLNATEVERGCILVKEVESQTVIETVWYLSGDAGPICDRDLSIIR